MIFGQSDSVAIDSIRYHALKEALKTGGEDDGSVKCIPMNIYKGMTQYTSEIENLAFQVPKLNDKILILQDDKRLLKADKEDLNAQISILKKDKEDLSKVEFKLMKEIGRINMERTDMKLKLRRKNRTIGIVAGVGGLCVTVLIIPIILLAR